MNEFTNTAKFMGWAVSILFALGLIGQLKPLTYKMAQAAIKAQEHQMSYGKFSRKLWDKK